MYFKDRCILAAPLTPAAAQLVADVPDPVLPVCFGAPEVSLATFWQRRKPLW